MKRVRFTIIGRVQGVGFRWYVEEKARKLGLNGFVRNIPDGDVMVMVEGSEDNIRKLEIYLWKGPAFASVENVIKQEEEYKGDLREFYISF
ncbi:MAG: acylphosphatase [Thermotoga sp.]|nr:acylphosphatase [Thermotogota bacterium]RKX52308.1 MAG: acylphosphatase [Thermotoga sp.]